MLSQLYHTNSGSNNLWLQHAQPTIPHQLRQQHSVAATCSANYTTPTQAATLCGCNMLNQLYHTNSGSNTLWLQNAQLTIPQKLRQQYSNCDFNMLIQLYHTNSGTNTLWLQHAQPTRPHHLRAILCGRNMLYQ